MTQTGRIMYGVPASDYHAIEALNASGAKLLLRSPAHFLADRKRERTQTPSMLLGSLVHSFLLEPDTIPRLYACAPKVDRRTKDGKATFDAFSAEHAGKLIVDLDLYMKAQRIAESVKRHPCHARYIEGAQTEVTLLWNQWGVPCKARLDAFKDNLVIDIKTTTDASPGGFARAVAQYQYHIQVAHYLAGVREATGWDAGGFVFIAVETEGEHEVGVYSLGLQSVAEGRACMFEAAEAYKVALDEAVEHKGYAPDVTEIELPAYALRTTAFGGGGVTSAPSSPNAIERAAQEIEHETRV